MSYIEIIDIYLLFLWCLITIFWLFKYFIKQKRSTNLWFYSYSRSLIQHEEVNVYFVADMT